MAYMFCGDKRDRRGYLLMCKSNRVTMDLLFSCRKKGDKVGEKMLRRLSVY